MWRKGPAGAVWASRPGVPYLRYAPCVARTPSRNHRLSCGRIDGVEAVSSHEDAIDATTSEFIHCVTDLREQKPLGST